MACSPSFVGLLAVATLLVILVACPDAASSSRAPTSRVVLEPLRASSAPAAREDSGWRLQTATPSRDATVKLTLAIKQRNPHLLQERLIAVSTPNSPQYGRYLSMDELTELVAPSSEALDAVFSWLSSHGVHNYALTLNRDFILAHVNVATAQEMLQCRFHGFVHTSGREALRCTEEYSLPSDVAQHIDFIGGVIRLPNIRGTLKVSKNSFVDAKKIDTTPEMIKSLYNITLPPVPRSNTQAVVSFLGQYYSPQDLAQFQQQFNTPNLTIEQTFGPNDPSKPGIEASLDVQYLTGVTGAGLGPSGSNIRTWVYSTPGELPYGNEPFLDWLVFLSNQTQIPYVFSISYQDLEYTVSNAYMIRVDAEFAKFGLRGRTFVTGSGDWGVGCKADFENCNKFVSDFPSCSPNIVSTGATFMNASSNEENGVAFSSGGFSWVFSRPSYQENVVNTYLKKTTVPFTVFNPKGRAFPDISAIGTNFQVVVNGDVMDVAGTSASTPTFAAILSLINSLRINAKLPTLGFVNPFLYRAVDAFTDITECEEQDSGCCSSSFSCEAGWDPYTGLGTPKFDKLAAIAMDRSFFNFP